MAVTATTSVSASLLERLDREQQALFDIGRVWRTYAGDLPHALQSITEAASRALAVERVSIWSYDRSDRSITCEDLFEATPKQHSHGCSLSSQCCPAYFAAMEAEQVISAERVLTDPRTVELAESYLHPRNIQSMLDVPIRAGGQLYGILCHEHVGSTRVFHDDEVHTGIYLANIVGAAVEFGQRVESEQRARRSLKLLQVASRKMEQMLQDELAIWRILFEQSQDGIFVLRKDGGFYEVNPRYAAMVGYGRDEFIDMRIWDLDCHFSREQVETMLQHPENNPPLFETRHRCKDGSVIDVEVSGIETSYKGKTLIFCIVRDVTERSALHEQLQRLATTDCLTGLLNRGAFTQSLNAEVNRAHRYGSPLALMMYDLDHFKQINDTYGHEVGDDVLRCVAHTVRECIRAADISARWGGEEFMVLLPHTDLTQAMAVAEKVRSTIASQSFDAVPSVTASFGVAQLEQNEDHESLVKRADTALYAAKSAGRNRIEAAA